MELPSPDTAASSPNPTPSGGNNDELLLASIRSILLAHEREQIGELEQRAETLRHRSQLQIEALRELIRALQAEVDRLQKLQADTEGLIARINPALSDMMSRTIRDSRDEMAEALGPQGALRVITARLRGVSPGQLALRDAIPFSIQEMFLIQRDSGLLVAHGQPGSPGVTDSDLISGMLTAIRDFVSDSFGQANEDKELDEVQYGDQRIIIQGGRTVYLAVVITGVEPEGFHARLHELVSELHVRHESAFRRYAGDPATLPNLQPALARLVTDTTAGSTTPTPTNTPAPSPTATLASTNTSTHAPMPAATDTPIPTLTPMTAFASGNVWVRSTPDPDAPLFTVLLKDTPVTVLSVFDTWVEVEWGTATNRQRGWAPRRWIATSTPIPAELVTPIPSR